MEACHDLSCVMQRGVATQATFTAATQQIAKVEKEPITFPDFAERMRPSILETEPHFTLPPPSSGRFIGILYQTFLI